MRLVAAHGTCDWWLRTAHATGGCAQIGPNAAAIDKKQRTELQVACLYVR